MEEKYIISEKVLKQIEGQLLYYPCSGNDLLVPIKIFAPYIKDFVFVDIIYFRSFKELRPVLYGKRKYKLLEQSIEGPYFTNDEWRIDEKTGERYPYIEPCIVKETYKHLESGEIFRVHRKRGFGFYTFRHYIKKLGVFFYRGDSGGEGGSGNYWLFRDHIEEVCQKLIDGGLFVTDGSNHGPSRRRNKYTEFWRFRHPHSDYDSKTPEELIKLCRPFKDDKGRYFECVGYAGMRYGPTMIWQMRKNN